jgi:hypothetical protein
LRKKNLLFLLILLLAVSVLTVSLLQASFSPPQEATPAPTTKTSSTSVANQTTSPLTGGDEESAHPSTPAMTTPSPTPTRNLTPTPSPVISGGEETIIRNANTEEEKRALATAENLNATEAFNIAPFTWNGYPYANFIDLEVINYYNNSHQNAKETTLFSYSANVYTWNQTHAVYHKTSSSISVSSPNGTILLPTQGGWGTQIRYVYLNSSRYQEINANEINFNFSYCYIVEMNLGYSQFLGPTTGFSSSVHQIVIVNEDFKPVLLCTQSQQSIS